MSIKTVEYKGQTVPEFITRGNHARFILPTAQEVCKGKGLDIGCGKLEWAFPGAVPIDLSFNDEFHANNLPVYSRGFDYIFSSHLLEHIDNYVETLEYWFSQLKSGGVLFLYLPHPECKYWRPWNLRKHKHILHPKDIEEIFADTLGITTGFVHHGCDPSYSYTAYGEKP